MPFTYGFIVLQYVFKLITYIGNKHGSVVIPSKTKCLKNIWCFIGLDTFMLNKL